MSKQSNSQITHEKHEVGHVEIMVRMPITMHKRFESIQQKERRSANAQVLYFLEQVPELQSQEQS